MARGKRSQDTGTSAVSTVSRGMRVVFDPSLLIYPSNMLLKPSVDNHTVLLTNKMRDVLFEGAELPTNLRHLLTLWGGKPEAIPLSIAWFKKEDDIRAKFNIIKEQELDKLKEFREEKLLVPLRRHIIDDDPNMRFISDDVIQFIADEICLALSDNTTPISIFCTQTSSWKIVDILKKIGANVKDEIIEYTERKTTYFKEHWQLVLCKMLGATLIWVFGAHFGAHHAGGIIHILEWKDCILLLRIHDRIIKHFIY